MPCWSSCAFCQKNSDEWRKVRPVGEIPWLAFNSLHCLTLLVGDRGTLCQYIGWSDVIYLWSQCDRHFVGQHVVLCVVKWWRVVSLFEQNSISWFKKMSVLSLSYWESDVYWRQNNKHFADLAPQNGGKQLIWRNYVTVTLCIKTCSTSTKIPFQQHAGRASTGNSPTTIHLGTDRWNGALHLTQTVLVKKLSPAVPVFTQSNNFPEKLPSVLWHCWLGTSKSIHL